LIRTTNGSREYMRSFAWPRPGGRAFFLIGNSTGSALSVPTGWTRDLAAGSYGGSASLSVLHRDASAGDSATPIDLNTITIPNDVTVGLFVHLKP
jgi:hypothetical protein